MACSAIYCSSRTTKEGVKVPELSFHTFPKCPQIKSEWIKAVRRDNWEPTKYSRLCSKHFDKSCYIAGLSIKKLKTDAVPTIFEGHPLYYERMEKDMSNYCQYKMGFSQKILMVDGVVPSKFECQQDSKRMMCDGSTLKPAFVKRQKTQLVPRCEDVQPTSTMQDVDSGTSITFFKKPKNNAEKCKDYYYRRKEAAAKRMVQRKTNAEYCQSYRLRRKMPTRGCQSVVPPSTADSKVVTCETSLPQPVTTDVTSKPLHHGVTCTYCQEEIEGHRYKCLQCESINMCTSCESCGQHPHHCVLRLPSPATYALVMACLTPVMTALNQRLNVSTLGKQIAVLSSDIKQEVNDELFIECDLNNPILSTTNDPLDIDQGSSTSVINVKSESGPNQNPVAKGKRRNEKKSNYIKLHINIPIISKVSNKNKNLALPTSDVTQKTQYKLSTPIHDMSTEIIDKKYRQSPPLSTLEVRPDEDNSSPGSSQQQLREGSELAPRPRNLADDMFEVYEIKTEFADV